jgi:hypothetical protein
VSSGSKVQAVVSPELIQGPGVLPNRGESLYIYIRDKKNWAVPGVGSRVKGGHLNAVSIVPGTWYIF